MVSKKVKDLLNNQVNAEFYSAYLYLDFSNYFKDAGLDGYANWYMIQAQEERDHAMLFIHYLQQQGEAARDTIRILSWLKSNASHAQVIVVANKVLAGVSEISKSDFEARKQSSAGSIIFREF